jgi:HSP20 family protein
MAKYVYKPNLLTIMDDFFNDMRPLTTGVTRAVYSSPALNVTEFKDRYEIKLFVPDLDPQKVKIELADKILNISYTDETETKDEAEDGTLIREEYRQFSFSRSLNLPKNVDESSIKAKSSRGTLLITVNKTPETQPKNVQVEME